VLWSYSGSSGLTSPKLPFIKDSYTVLSPKYTIWGLAQGRNRLEAKYAIKLREDFKALDHLLSKR
jgi:hypothetical protein